MKKIEFGAERRKVSPVGMGCWGISGSKVWCDGDDRASRETIIAACESGIDFFDTAPIYGMGHSEEVLGETLGELGNREELFIATKCGLPWDGKGNVIRHLGKESILKEAEDSLRRLRTDYIDLYQFHWPDANHGIDESLEALRILKEQGKVRNFGLTNFSLTPLRHAHESLADLGGIAAYQGLYNFCERNPISYHGVTLEYRTEREILPYCEEMGISFIPYSPLFQGLLTGAYGEETRFGEGDVRNSNPKLHGDFRLLALKAVDRLRSIADDLGKPLSQLGINWLLSRSTVGPVINGALTADQIRENAGAMEWSLDDETLERIEEVFVELNLVEMDLV